jgi:hypothetical protein
MDEGGTMIRRKLVRFGLIALFSLGLIVPGQAVQAGSLSWSGCTEGLLCVWGQIDYEGNWCAFDVSTWDHDWHNFSVCTPNMINNIGSWRNHTAYDAKFATELGGNGTVVCVNEWSSDPDVAPNRNDFASFRIFAADNNVC